MLFHQLAAVGRMCIIRLCDSLMVTTQYLERHVDQFVFVPYTKVVMERSSSLWFVEQLCLVLLVNIDLCLPSAVICA